MKKYIGGSNWQNNWVDPNLTDVEAMKALVDMRPEGWKPECSKVSCYIKKQHPARDSHVQYDETLPMKDTGWKAVKCTLRNMWRTYEFYSRSKYACDNPGVISGLKGVWDCYCYLPLYLMWYKLKRVLISR